MAKTLSVTYFVFCLVFVGCVKPFCHCEPDSRIRLDVLIVNQQGQKHGLWSASQLSPRQYKNLKDPKQFFCTSCFCAEVVQRHFGR